MFTFETADQKEVRRFRIAQFNGRAATASKPADAKAIQAALMVKNLGRIVAQTGRKRA